VGPFAGGFIHDRAGDYRLAWWLNAARNVMALSLLAFKRPPAPRDEPTAA
jgi:cyanate permease